MASFQDATRSDSFVITAEDRMKHDIQFNQLKPIAGFITGEQAKVFFVQSRLPTPILSRIWQLSDMNADGRMDRREFSIAMHLIKRTLLGFDLPAVLPSSLLIEQPHPVGVPVVSAFGTSAVSVPFMQTTPTPVPLHGSSVSTGGFNSTIPANFAVQQRPPVSTSTGDWCIPQGQRLKYKQLFNNTDMSHKGYLTGLEAKTILSQSGLVHSLLAQIWSLADIDTDGNLSPDEFCVAMFLIDLAKSGQPVPAALPTELIPPAYRRMRRPSETVSVPLASTSLVSSGFTGPIAVTPKLDAFGDLAPGFGLGGPVPIGVQAEVVISQTPDADPLKVVTFEDKRKENFEMGQAELERRRAMLREQQQKETEERMAAERAEHEKRERIRLEQEHKKQMEMEKQLEKQRQLEMEREEQRKKAMEQREAARQELERQRQLEWERQRRDQLMSEKQREQSQVDRLRLEVGQLKLENESYETKKMELFSRIEQVRQSVTEFTSAIDTMKLSRDAKLSDIEHFQSDFEEWNMKLVAAQQERLRLSRQVHTPDPDRDDNFKMVETNYRSRRGTVDHLASRLEKTEEEKAGINKQVLESVGQLNELKNQMNSLMSDYSGLEKSFNAKKAEWEERTGRPSSVPVLNTKLDAFGSESGKTNAGDSLASVDWFSDFKKPSTTTSTNSSLDAWGMTSATSGSTAPAATNDAWAFGTGVDAATKETQGNSNAWANFDGTEAFGSSSSQAQEVTWAADFFPAMSTNVEKKDTAKKSNSLEGFRKFVALYQFDARNPDELSLMQGDTVWVKLDQSKAEPDWMIGQRDSTEGCFPMAYVQQASTDIFPDIPTKSDSSKTNNNEPWPPQSDMFSAGDVVYDTPLRTSDSKGSGNNSSNMPQPVMGQLTASAESPFIPVSSSAPLSMPGQTQSKGGTIEGLQVLALYPWQAKKENHLTFKKGDVINVLDQQDIWWSGQLNGKVGWFPKSYVKVTGGDLSNTTSTKTNQEPTTPKLESFPDIVNSSMRFPTPPNGTPASRVSIDTTDKERSTPEVKRMAPLGGGLSGSPSSAATPKNSQTPTVGAEPTNGTDDIVVVAMYSYNSNEPDDLMFNQGDVFTIQKMDGDWWKGTFNGKTGIFPSSYVRVMETLTPQKLAGSKKPEIASVIAPYQSTGQEQLTLQPGQLIHVRKKSPSGWWEGELQARGVKRRVGWFPANYVKLLGQGSSATTTPDIQSAPPPESLKASMTSTNVTSLPIEQVISLYNYQAQRDDELSFTKGSTINIINKDESDWWKGEFNGKVGMFPSNYVTSKDHILSS